MTAAILFFLAVSNIAAWFVIGRHSSTLQAFRKNNIRTWASLEKCWGHMVHHCQQISALGRWNAHQDKVMNETILGMMTTTGAEGTKKKPSQKVKITRK